MHLWHIMRDRSRWRVGGAAVATTQAEREREIEQLIATQKREHEERLKACQTTPCGGFEWGVPGAAHFFPLPPSSRAWWQRPHHFSCSTPPPLQPGLFLRSFPVKTQELALRDLQEVAERAAMKEDTIKRLVNPCALAPSCVDD